MKGLINALAGYFEKNSGNRGGWSVGYCKSCDGIVFVTGAHNPGQSADYKSYGFLQVCSCCNGRKYLHLESLLMGELTVVDSVRIFDRSLEKLRKELKRDGAPRDSCRELDGEIARWMRLDEGNKCLMLQRQRRLREVMGESGGDPDYCFPGWLRERKDAY